MKTKTVRHGRFAYGGYFEGPAPHGAPDASLWFLDPDMVAAFPTDHGLTFYACMPTSDHLPEFRRDPEAALKALVASVPDAPPIAESRVVPLEDGKPVQGKIDMTNVWHEPTAPGLALIGDAALAIDPLWGVGCGWAFQSSEWLANSVSGSLLGAEPLERGLAALSKAPRARPARPRGDDLRLRGRQEVQPRRAPAVLRGGARRTRGAGVRGLRHAQRSGPGGCSPQAFRWRSPRTRGDSSPWDERVAPASRERSAVGLAWGGFETIGEEGEPSDG